MSFAWLLKIVRFGQKNPVAAYKRCFAKADTFDKIALGGDGRKFTEVCFLGYLLPRQLAVPIPPMLEGIIFLIKRWF